MVRFYTLPPPQVKYPYIFVTMLNYQELYRRDFEHAIVDSGVEFFFHKRKYKDYPRTYLEKYKVIARALGRTFGDSVWVTIPDYPDDYEPGQCFENGMDNVDKSLRNVEEFITIDGVEWLPVIQSRFENAFSFIESCERLKDLIKDFPRVAIGTVCKSRKVKWIRYCIATARSYFPRSWIHAFGLTLRALSALGSQAVESYRSWTYRTLAKFSFDSRAWDYGNLRWYDKLVRDSWRKYALEFYPKTPAKYCASDRAKIAYFLAYLKRISELTGEDLLSLAEVL